jgi:hypothetical protein
MNRSLTAREHQEVREDSSRKAAQEERLRRQLEKIARDGRKMIFLTLVTCIRVSSEGA